MVLIQTTRTPMAAAINELIPRLRATAVLLSNTGAERADDYVEQVVRDLCAGDMSDTDDITIRSFRLLRHHIRADKRHVTTASHILDGGNKLRLALAQCSLGQREAILLQASGFKYRDIADICGVEIGTVRSRINRGKTTLNRLFEERPETLQ